MIRKPINVVGPVIVVPNYRRLHFMVAWDAGRYTARHLTDFQLGHLAAIQAVPRPL